jgi:hypothetical protein
MRRENGERTTDICRSVWLAHSTVHKIRDNADRIKESAKSGTKEFASQDYHSPIRINHTENCRCLLHIIALEINKYNVYKYMHTV